MAETHVDFTDDKPLDIPWPEEIKDIRAELGQLEDVDLVKLLQEISKIRLEVVKQSKKKQEGPKPLSEEAGIRYLSTAINELRRLTPEVANLRQDVEEKTREDSIRELFSVIDAFDRFFDSAKAMNDPRLERWMEGIKQVYNSVLMILRKNEVKEIPARGTFNPKFQAAISIEERNDLPPDTIIRVERRGFILGKKILRTPEVVISKRTDLID